MSKPDDWTHYGARSDELPLVEPNSFTAVFVTALARIERVPGECAQMTFARAGTDGLGNPQLLVDGPPLIMPISLLPELVAKLAAWVKAGSPANRRPDHEQRTH